MPAFQCGSADRGAVSFNYPYPGAENPIAEPPGVLVTQDRRELDPGSWTGLASAGRSAAPGIPEPRLWWAFLTAGAHVTLGLPRGDPFPRGGPGTWDLGPLIEGCPQHEEGGALLVARPS
ncbi:hypothetical protein NDU88_002037 [Pleurodeles waltl]|uniref:Uncharacterized protein n=1 Tax=Pleurodeles waltl TaxID=8319 RepID=A0AAV7RC47_PLEWA|nr:hypothetical protein NDU88_002037 [Pleurodeles waltl]